VRVHIRARRESDVPRCVELLAAVHRADGYPLRWPADPDSWLRPDGTLAAYVAEDGAAIVGHVLLVDAVSGGDAEVSRLFASPGRRRGGVGTALLRRAERRATELGRTRLVLEVYDERAAATFYERAGWRRAGVQPADWALADGTLPLFAHYDRALRP
jgi:GNAT superfamily N-acetyltransferase